MSGSRVSPLTRDSGATVPPGELSQFWPDRGFAGQIPQDLLKPFFRLGRTKNFTRGTAVPLAGDVVYLLLRGCVMEQGGAGNGLLRGSGELLGDTDLYAPNSELYFARTITSETTCVVITVPRLVHFMQQEPKISFALIWALSRRVQSLGARRAVDCLNSIGRTAWLLLEISEALGTAENPAARLSGMSQEMMAASIGQSPAAVQNDLRELRYRGAIETGYRTVHIRDRKQLERLVPPGGATASRVGAAAV
ncbi:Crp/Fnr family transcriptional regulator [Streptomyces sp. NPDC041068]|uniref:Crp/Fnr family transcriptional regulator n=1 Tax=Streptomyces sp. NPDC041068 TaxID=3155130 RepID=UPI003408C3C1